MIFVSSIGSSSPRKAAASFAFGENTVMYFCEIDFMTEGSSSGEVTPGTGSQITIGKVEDEVPDLFELRALSTLVTMS